MTSKVYFPDLTKASEVFSEAQLATGMPPRDSDWLYLSGIHAYTGGTYYKTACGIGHRNSQFTSLWVKPHPFIVEKIEPQMISRAGGMAFDRRFRRVDLKDDLRIGTRYVTYLDEGETPLSLLDPVERKFWFDELARYEEFKNEHVPT